MLLPHCRFEVTDHLVRRNVLTASQPHARGWTRSLSTPVPTTRNRPYGAHQAATADVCGQASLVASTTEARPPCIVEFGMEACSRQPGSSLTTRCMRLQPSNKALKLTKGAEVRAPRHSASLRRCSVPRSTFFTNVPSQLNAVFDRLPHGHGHGNGLDAQRRGRARYALLACREGCEAEGAPRLLSHALTALVPGTVAASRHAAP